MCSSGSSPLGRATSPPTNGIGTPIYYLVNCWSASSTKSLSYYHISCFLWSLSKDLLSPRVCAQSDNTRWPCPSATCLTCLSIETLAFPRRDAFSPPAPQWTTNYSCFCYLINLPGSPLLALPHQSCVCICARLCHCHCFCIRLLICHTSHYSCSSP